VTSPSSKGTSHCGQARAIDGIGTTGGIGASEAPHWSQ
jgi:hypothetical protein